MTTSELAALAQLLSARDALDEQIAGIVGGSAAAGRVGDWIAARIFRIRLAETVNPAYDGWFDAGTLAGRTVTVKWYAQRESLLDMSISPAPDHYLVLTGPRPGPVATERPWVIGAVHLFSAAALLAERTAKGVRIGVATSVPSAMWQAAEIYPRAANPDLRLDPDQVAALRLFAPRGQDN